MTFDTAAPTTLRDVPDWRYMMQECDELYRYLPAGGSDRIKSHQRKAREAIARLLRGNAELRLQPRAEKPVTAVYLADTPSGSTITDQLLAGTRYLTASACNCAGVTLSISLPIFCIA